MFERFPGLRIASVENGAEFLPDLFNKLRSTVYKMPGYFHDDPVASFREHVWINPFWEDDVTQTVALMGADRVIFGSDWPHIEGMPEPLDYLPELKSFDDDERLLILRDNARSLTELRPGPELKGSLQRFGAVGRQSGVMEDVAVGIVDGPRDPERLGPPNDPASRPSAARATSRWCGSRSC